MSSKDRSPLGRRIMALHSYNRMGLDAKVRYAQRLIERALETAERPMVAWSGGKDSTLLLHLVRQYKPDVIVGFNNTGVEFPETTRFVKRMHNEWNLNLHITRPEPGKSFWWCVEQFGFPLLGKDFARKTPAAWATDRQRKVMNSDVRVATNCCWHLKEKPAIDLQRELGVDLIFLGIMASESNRRRLTWGKYGDFRWNQKEKLWKVLPLSVWLEQDAWQYHEQHDVPMCELYAKGHKRNGCWPCGMNIGFAGNHLATLRQTHPKLWRFLMIDKGLAQELLKLKLVLSDGQADLFSTTWSVEELLEQRPCFFDRV